MNLLPDSTAAINETSGEMRICYFNQSMDLPIFKDCVKHPEEDKYECYLDRFELHIGTCGKQWLSFVVELMNKLKYEVWNRE